MRVLIGIVIAVVVVPAVIAFKLWGFPVDDAVTTVSIGDRVPAC